MLNLSRAHLNPYRKKSNKGYKYTQIISKIFPPKRRQMVSTVVPNVTSFVPEAANII